MKHVGFLILKRNSNGLFRELPAVKIVASIRFLVQDLGLHRLMERRGYPTVYMT